MVWTSSKWDKYGLSSSIWPWWPRSIIPKTLGILTQGNLFYWLKFGNPGLNGLQVIAWTTSGLTHGRTHRQTDAGNDNTRKPKLASGENKLKYSKSDIQCLPHTWLGRNRLSDLLATYAFIVSYVRMHQLYFYSAAKGSNCNARIRLCQSCYIVVVSQIRKN